MVDKCVYFLWICARGVRFNVNRSAPFGRFDLGFLSHAITLGLTMCPQATLLPQPQGH